MILVLFFLIIFFLFALFTSKIRLEIKNFKLSNIEKNDSIKELNFTIKLYIFSFIKILQKNIDKEDLKNISKLNKINNLLQKFKNKKNKEFKNKYSIVKNIKIDLKTIDLNIEIGTEDVILTSFIVFVVSTIISIFLGMSIKKYNSKKYKYIIAPMYNEKNSIKLTLLGIVDFNLVNIINILLKLYFRSDKNDKRTSYREFNVNSNEQYPTNDRC